jgi:predicted PurR-regulated permease PerM/phosphoglycolate phosphatase-like HAD superfamily hydrolase
VSTRWSPFTKQLFVICCLVASVWLVFRIRILWTPLLLVFILSFLASYPVNGILRRTGWPRKPVVVVVYLLLLILIGVAAAGVIPRVVILGSGLASTFTRVLYELTRITPEPIELTPTLVLDLGELYRPIRESLTGILHLDPAILQRLQDAFFPFATGAAAVVIRAVSGVLGTLLVLILSFYLVKDWPKIARYALTRAPDSLRPELRRLWGELSAVSDAFVRGQLIAGFVMGLMIAVALSLLGVRNGPALGLLAMICEFIPGIGPFISAVVGILIALTFGSSWLPISHLWFALIVLVVYLLFGQFQNLYVVPHVIGRRIDLHPVVILIGALIGAELLGILGLLLAAPVIASLRVLLGYAFNKLLDQDPFSVVREPVDTSLVWRDLAYTRDIRALLFDLDGTLIETDDAAVQSLAQRLSFMERVLPVTNRTRVARRLLMTSEVFVNSIVTLLDRLRLDGLLFRMSDTLNRWRGVRVPGRFVAVAGTPEMLAALADCYALAVVTSRSRAESLAFLEQYSLTGLVAVVISRDDAPHLKPHPMPIRLAAARLSLQPEQCVMVGDTGVDIRSAKAAGALAVGVLCGFGERQDLTNADLILDTTADLVSWLPNPPPDCMTHHCPSGN